MQKHVHGFALGFLGTLLLAGCAPTVVKELPEKVIKPKATVRDKLMEMAIASQKGQLPFVIPPGTNLDTVVVDSAARTIEIRLTKHFSALPFREKNVREIYETVRSFLGSEYAGYSLAIQTLGQPIENLIPNYYRNDPSTYDVARLPRKKGDRPLPVIRHVSRPFTPTLGLFNRNIVLWPSHGWYYKTETDRWEWQRPRLFQSVEDLIPWSFTIPYIVPMLEKAGATVFVPRERDTQTHEVVVDNDTPSRIAPGAYRETSKRRKYAWKKGDDPGFAYGTPPYPANFNPFVQGTHRVAQSESTATATVTWTPVIPETGEYAVYISYGASEQHVPDAHYTVYHEGGTTEFIVNQQVGGHTWHYLGHFTFRAGRHGETGRLVLTNQSSQPGRIVSADAVRFGGGMGLVMRNGSASGRPKYVEGSRYYLQYAGMPDSMVYNLNEDKNDYRDDYQSRPEYVNYLYGAPFGPKNHRAAKGLGIPIDVSLAFHTDAGITHSDTTIGTLSIYSILDTDTSRVFPDSVSRFANRDLADIVQTQIVGDLRALYDPIWTRRELRDADYSEATRPMVPGMLLELLSHQNFLDMKFVLDPRFRFDVARAIYKGMLRFLSVQNGVPYVVQPLAVTHMSTSFTAPREVTLRWRPAVDPLEPTATAGQYIVYTRIGDGGFDNGRLVSEPAYTLKGVKPGVTYSFKVTAVNAGGESFPSEILSVCWVNARREPVLVVNGFDRVSGPAAVESPVFAGFMNALDSGVPDNMMVNFTGSQFDFDPASPFRLNDSPGHGASHADHEGQVIAGNTFDYPSIHGRALKECGLSFVSCSDEAVMDTVVDVKKFRFVDLILGKERQTHWQKPVMDSLRGVQFEAFPVRLREELRGFLNAGGNLFVSGSYIGTDLFARRKSDSSGVEFAEKVLHCTWVTDHAALQGRVVSAAPSFLPKATIVEFNTTPGKTMYVVDAPDALGPVNGSQTILRYAEDLFSAATAYKNQYGVVAFGFPFETILGEKARTEVMRSVLRTLRVE